MINRLYRVQRLRNRDQFRKVYEQGRFVSNRLLAIHFFPREKSISKVGFAAGKRLGNAVCRNRCKRRMRELFRTNQSLLTNEYDMIFIARKAMLKSSWLELLSAGRDALAKIRHISQKKRD